MKTTRKTVLILLYITAIFTINMYGQDVSEFRFNKIEVDDGLSENTVNCMLQDSRGFVWFGTKDGLNRYDGNEFKIFRNDPNSNFSLGNNFIFSLLEGDTDTLYVGTDAGLYIMNLADESFTKYNHKTEDGIEITSGINGMAFDATGRLWVATVSQGIFVISENKELRSVAPYGINLDSNATWCILRDKEGIIYIGTRLGLLRYDARTDRLEAVAGLTGHTAPQDEVICIAEDGNYGLWLGTWEEGIIHYNRHNGKIDVYGGRNDSPYISHVRCMFNYSENEMLIGADDGLYMLNRDTGVLTRKDIPHAEQSLSDQNVYSIMQDHEGSLWFGTYFGGINYCNTTLLSVETYSPNNDKGALSGRAVGQFCEDEKGNMWIATEDGGLNYFNTATKRFTQPIKTTYHNIQALLLDDGKLWIGTMSRGIDIYDLRSSKMINLRHNAIDEHTINNDCVFALYKTVDGTIYVGTSEGLNRYNSRRRNFERISDIKGLVRDIKEDNLGNLWVATATAGAHKLDKQSGQWVHYDEVNHRRNPIVGRKLSSINTGARGEVFFTSEGNGIYIYDSRTDSFRNISQVDGLPSNVTYGALEDRLGNLWVSSNVGVICLNPDSLAYRLYAKEDGLQSAQFNFKSSYKARNGKFYFGGINGFSCFYPQELIGMKNTAIPPVVITSLRTLGGDADDKDDFPAQLYRGTAIQLPYNKASFTISYVCLSYKSVSRNNYAYKLEGLDDDWNYVGQNRTVTYSNLRPGKYTFRVKASNNDGVWNTAGAAVTIKILPPFYLSAVAKTLYSVLFIIICYLSLNAYRRRLHRKQAEVRRTIQVEEEKRSFRSKINFITNIAHEIRTPLSLISAPLEEVIVSGDGNNLTRQNLAIIEKNRDKLLSLVNQLIDFRKMDDTEQVSVCSLIDLRELLDEFDARFRKTAQNKHIELRTEMPDDKNLSVVSDADAVNKIVSNFLTNALKFTSDRIVLRLTRNANKSFTISVTDNGKGISNDYKIRIFDPLFQINSSDAQQGSGIGLSLAKNLAEMINGTIEVNDAVGGGSCFSFTFSDLPLSVGDASANDSVHKDNMAEEHGDANDVMSTAANVKPRILIVDDNTDMTSFIKQSLDADYGVDVADDVPAAMKLIDINSYDLIISDIMMPGIDGISFAHSLKSDIKYSHIPIILLSALTDNSSKATGLQSGADVYLEKPFSIQHLRAQINSLLSNRKALLEVFNRTPQMPYSVLATNKSDEYFLKRLNEEIEKNIADENFSVESIADTLAISRSNLQRKVKSICNVTPGEYLRVFRLRRALRMLTESDLRVNEVAFQLGFNSASYFTKAFYKYYNMTPTEYIAQHLSR